MGYNDIVLKNFMYIDNKKQYVILLVFSSKNKIGSPPPFPTPSLNLKSAKMWSVNKCILFLINIFIKIGYNYHCSMRVAKFDYILLYSLLFEIETGKCRG